MKKFWKSWLMPMLTVLMVFSMTACSSDSDDDDDNDSTSIVGKWLTMNSVEDISPDEYFIFDGKGNVTWIDDDWSDIGSYTLKGNKLKIVFEYEDEDDYWIDTMDGTVTVTEDIMSYKFKWHWWSREEGDEYGRTETLMLERVK